MYAMVRRRALAAGIGTKIGNDTFRVTGITAYLKTVARSRTPRRWRITRRRAPPKSPLTHYLRKGFDLLEKQV